MCTVCGCGTGSVEGQSHDHHHGHGHEHGHGGHHHHGHDHHHHGAGHSQRHDEGDAHHHHGGGHAHDHNHAHHHHHGAHGDIHFGQGAAGVAVGNMSQERLIEIETGILSENDRYAAANRARLAGQGVFAVNLVSSPGSGKTTLLCATIRAMTADGGGDVPVIEGDQQTTNDADRIRETGAPAVQVNTGKGCHLDGHMVGHALDHLHLHDGATLFIENVGNLVCPAAFDLGEDAKVAILSVTEGEDKPLKYPDMFTAARIALLNKIDLAPHCDVDLDLYEANLRRVNPTIEIIRVSARTGEGLDQWIGWLRSEAAAKRLAQAAE
ncbi:hydrogenase nickel incorporation protein HypB [Salipiger thiooxidans]|uniref:hydrogenase nickel incorporation protein HypB n=1 Tax=Salipiger thiooxidans TaxID=282683 RepID=UPI001CD42BD0|nr:hydrogenase nickel incorporation protein HypB [Salipiger thiooxidans]MCA0847071.1 hydrogenase nickel incorporation protein HypB [Salipiger thiooxidans]